MANQQDVEPMFSGLDPLSGEDEASLTASLLTTTAALNASPTVAVSQDQFSTGSPSFYQPGSNWGLPYSDTPPYESYETGNPFGDLYSNQFTFAQQSAAPPPQFAAQIPQRSRLGDQVGAATTDASSIALKTETQMDPGSIGGLPEATVQSSNILTAAQQEALKNIAMPTHLQYRSPKSEPSPHSSLGGHSPDAGDPTKSLKRKSSADDEEDDEDDDDSPHPIKKTAHNMIEKRYRTNLNDKIAALRDSVPSLRIMSKSARGEDTTEDREELHGLTPAHKLNKATVLSKATEYIRHLEKRNNRLIDENTAMQQRIGAFEKLFMHGAMNGAISPPHPPTPMQYPQDAGMFAATPMQTPRGPDPSGMIQVPDDMKRILQAQAANRPYPVPQQPYQANPALMRQQLIQQQQQAMAAGRWQNAGPYFGKLMVGSLAGLMILEAVRESEQSNETPEGRGLFAAPLQLLGSIVYPSHVSLGGYQFSTAQVLANFKLVVILGSLLWVFVPSLFAPRPSKTAKSRVIAPNLKAVPSLASPIHVRRQAWLTAIQTVWVPRHNFFLEAAALLLKTVKLSLRNAIGVHGFQMLTGLTEEQETARVKAWTIALDAQLAGGDVEISKSRLILTLLASGTLPDTPLRLMMKALHIRVLLLHAGISGVMELAAAKLARSKWNEAKQLHLITSQLRRTLPQATSVEDELPDHLALLLEQDCDSVFDEIIVRRAHNLAWNNSTNLNVLEQVDGMNAVVDDPAVRSPMDAVAAWWSCSVLHQALSKALSDGEGSEDVKAFVQEKVDLAANVAPVGSNAQLRALVARAVFVDEKRGSSIAKALHALGPSMNPDKHPHYSSGVPPLIDSPLSAIVADPNVQMSLRCAMGIAHLQRFTAPPKDALILIDSILQGPADAVSLLGVTAAFKLMNCLHQHSVAAEACSNSLERLAGTLRIWMGGPAGDECGLDQDVRQLMVKQCLHVTKSIVGMMPDQGYVSMSECDSEDGGC